MVPLGRGGLVFCLRAMPISGSARVESVFSRFWLVSTETEDGDRVSMVITGGSGVAVGSVSLKEERVRGRVGLALIEVIGVGEGAGVAVVRSPLLLAVNGVMLETVSSFGSWL